MPHTMKTHLVHCIDDCCSCSMYAAQQAMKTDELHAVVGRRIKQLSSSIFFCQLVIYHIQYGKIHDKCARVYMSRRRLKKKDRSPFNPSVEIIIFSHAATGNPETRIFNGNIIMYIYMVFSWYVKQSTVQICNDATGRRKTSMLCTKRTPSRTLSANTRS